MLNRKILLSFLCASFACVVSIQTATALDPLFDKRIERWKKQANNGDKRAQYWLGDYQLKNGNISAAVSWLEKSAKQGYLKAAYKLGTIYYKKRKYGLAYRWFLKAAHKHYPPAQYYIGKLYFKGQGTRRDMGRALYWAKRAESNDYLMAKHLIDEIESRMGKKKKPAKTAAKSTPKPKKPIRVASSTKVRLKQAPKKPKAPLPPRVWNTKQIVASGYWMLNKKPAEHMPSSVNKCEIKNNDLECISERLYSRNDVAKVDYSVKSTFSNFKPNGSFEIVHQKNIIFVLPDDPDDPDPDGNIPRAGWEKTKHKLRCKVRSLKTIECRTQNLQVERYSKN
jgi:hypothetical protein